MKNFHIFTNLSLSLEGITTKEKTQF